MSDRVVHVGPGTRHCYRLTDFKGLDAQMEGRSWRESRKIEEV